MTKANIDEQMDILINAIRAQKSLLDYNGYYIAYLLNQLTEEEFRNIANQFAIEPENTININILSRNIEVLLRMTHLPFSTHELADIFACDESIIERCMRMLQIQGAIEA